MKTAVEILREQLDYDHISGLVDEEGRIENSVIKAMKEYAEEYHIYMLRKEKPNFCKACQYHSVIDAFGGEYCRVLKKCVASPNEYYIDAECPLK